jgi:hypothetical protein
MGFRVCYWMVWKGDLVEVDDGVEAVSAAGYQAVNGDGGGGGHHFEPARSMSWRIMER